MNRLRPRLERASKSRASHRRIADLHAYLDAYAYAPFPADQDAPANLGARFIYAALARSVKLKSRLQPRNKKSVACTTQQVEVIGEPHTQTRRLLGGDLKGLLRTVLRGEWGKPASRAALLHAEAARPRLHQQASARLQSP